MSYLNEVGRKKRKKKKGGGIYKKKKKRRRKSLHFHSCYINGRTTQYEVPSSGCETLQLLEDADSVSGGLDDISLGQDTLSKCLK